MFKIENSKRLPPDTDTDTDTDTETGAGSGAGNASLIEDGASLTRAASILAISAGVPAADIATALRAIGFVDQVLYLGEVIRVIALNQQRFESLSKLLPNLPQIFAAFELVASGLHPLP